VQSVRFTTSFLSGTTTEFAMPRTTMHHCQSNAAAAPRFIADTFHFSTRYAGGFGITNTYYLGIDIDGGTLNIVVICWTDQLSSITAKLVMVEEKDPVFTPTVLQNVLQMMSASVPLFRTDDAIRRQLTTYVEHLPAIYDECRVLPIAAEAICNSLDAALAGYTEQIQ
jgi:hypothetical protein